MAKKRSSREIDHVAKNKLAETVKLSNVLLDGPKTSQRTTICYGTDDRELVQDSKAKPFRFICRIEGSKNKSLKVGTAFIIGRRTLVTAAHNLWVDEQGKPNVQSKNRIRNFTVYPGATETTAPFGSFRATAEPYPSYIGNMHVANDAAVLKLERDLPASFSALPWLPVNPTDLDGKICVISGYPACRPNVSKCKSPQRNQYFQGGSVAEQAGILHYLIDTTGGQSGSPILVVTKTADGELQSTAVGIHTKGGRRNQTMFNRGVAFREDIARFILQKFKSFEPKQA